MANPREESKVLHLVVSEPNSPEESPKVAEVVQARDPGRGGRVLVRWSSEAGRVQQAWACTMAGVEPQPGQHVLLSHPSNWPEPVVTGCLAVEGHASLRLQPGQHLTIEDAEGQPLVHLHGSEGGPVMKFAQPDVSLQAAGKLRLIAEGIELQAAKAGVTVQAEGDTVVRGRTIQLN